MHHFPDRGAHEAGIDRKEGLEGGSCKPNQYEEQYGVMIRRWGDEWEAFHVP